MAAFLFNEEDKPIELSFENIVEILEHLILTEVSIYKLTQKTISIIFSYVKENILCNFIDKVSWLKATYGMQNGSFMNLTYMEEVPMNLFLVMYEIHKEAVDSVNKET